MLKLTMDGRRIEAQPEETILQAATRSGIRIPTLCHHKKLSPIGSCRVCMVEVEGAEKPMAACTTPAVEGMVVRTQGENLRELRRTAIALMLVNHRLDCPVCDKSGACTLQDLAYEYQVAGGEWGAIPPPTDIGPYATPLITYHPHRCVLCGRCVRACKEIKCVEALSLENRGSRAYVKGHPERCISCGECVHVCPVGALTQNLTRPPFRSHRMKKVPTTCPYCGVGCQLELNVADDRIWDITTDDDMAPNRGSLCVKGRFGFDFVHHPDRLTRPLIRENGSLREASWEEAFRFTAARLREIVDSRGPDSVMGFASARCTNEENYLFQKFIRAGVGTNNVDHCARL
jgi:predicted molibdopterin-dependent oxidoreductase YjgC